MKMQSTIKLISISIAFKLSYLQSTFSKFFKMLIGFITKILSFMTISFTQVKILFIKDNSEYKVAFLEKPLKFRNFERNFKIIKSSKNWITLGICHRKIVEERNFGFRYHTIGHGIYGLSSNGGSWSHYRSEFNNIICGPQFKENEIIKVRYDSAYNRVKFILESGEKYTLDVDPIEKGVLNFCIITYYENDEVEMIA